MKPLIKKIIKLSVRTLIAFAVFLTEEYFFPVPILNNSFIYSVGFIFLMALALDKISDSSIEIFHFIKKEFNIRVLIGILFELSLTFILLLPTKNPLVSTLYLSIFWLSSGLMRVCIENTTLIYKAGKDRVLNFIKNFSIIRLTYYTSLAFFLFMETNSLIASSIFLIIMIIFYGFSHRFNILPLFKFITQNSDFEKEIDILRIIYNESMSLEKIAKRMKDVRKYLNNLINQKRIEFTEGKYRIAKKVRFNISK